MEERNGTAVIGIGALLRLIRIQMKNQMNILFFVSITMIFRNLKKCGRSYRENSHKKELSDEILSKIERNMFLKIKWAGSHFCGLPALLNIWQNIIYSYSVSLKRSTMDFFAVNL